MGVTEIGAELKSWLLYESGGGPSPAMIEPSVVPRARRREAAGCAGGLGSEPRRLLITLRDAGSGCGGDGVMPDCAAWAELSWQGTIGRWLLTRPNVMSRLDVEPVNRGGAALIIRRPWVQAPPILT